MTRWFAVGDPQTTFEKFLSVLRASDILDARDRVREDVGLVSMGDHFDFWSAAPVAEVGQHGTKILRWLADHSAEQVVILMGNHDAARVMELAHETDESYAAARALAEHGDELAFQARFPRIPLSEIVRKDYKSFAEHQRTLVQELLLAGRMRLACVGRRGSQDILLTHAGVTDGQVAELGVATPRELAAALNRRLADAVARVRNAWENGANAELDLRPLHHAGETGREGGGLLYHRPSGKGPDTDNPVAPRRYSPDRLPRGLVQVCGHTGHHKCLEDLKWWLGPVAAQTERGGLRTLSVGATTAYEQGIEAPRENAATLYLIDIEMNTEQAAYPLLPLDDVSAFDNRSGSSPSTA
jgi:hypothetical protein